MIVARCFSSSLRVQIALLSLSRSHKNASDLRPKFSIQGIFSFLRSLGLLMQDIYCKLPVASLPMYHMCLYDSEVAASEHFRFENPVDWPPSFPAEARLLFVVGCEGQAVLSSYSAMCVWKERVGKMASRLVLKPEML